jgi:hypothetical protein
VGLKAYYSILDIDVDASTEDIKRAFLVSMICESPPQGLRAKSPDSVE